MDIIEGRVVGELRIGEKEANRSAESVEGHRWDEERIEEIDPQMVRIDADEDREESG